LPSVVFEQSGGVLIKVKVISVPFGTLTSMVCEQGFISVTVTV